MKRTRKWSIMLMVVIMAVIVSACGSKSNSSSNSSASGSSPAASGNSPNTSPSNKPVELSLWTDWVKNDPFTKDYFKRMEQFQAAYPNIHLKMEVIPYNDFNVKLQTQAAGGQLPDIVQLITGGSNLEPLARAGLLKPIDDMVGQWKDTKIPAGLLKEFAVNGKQYAIPAEVNYSSMIFYNKKILADLGYSDFPKTYKDFLGLIKAANAKKITPIAIGNKTGQIATQGLLSVITNRIAGADFNEQVLAKNKKLTDPEFISSLNIIKEMADNNAFNKDANNIDNQQATDLFLTGHSLMNIDGSWTIKQILQNKSSDFQVGFALFPTIDGGKGDPVSLSAGTNQGLGLNAKLDGDKLEAAKTFFKFMYSDELFQSLLSSGALVTANVSLSSDASPEFKKMVDVTKQVSSISSIFNWTMPKDVITSVNNGLQGLISGNVTPDKVATDTQKLLK